MSLTNSAAIQLAPQRYREPLLQTLDEFQIKNPTEFLATVFYESNYLETLSENLNYTCDALLKRFGRHRITYAEAMKYGRNPPKPAYQEAIANCIYGGKWGRDNLGNYLPGDGWHYRGQGAIQLTGRENWELFGTYLGREDIACNPFIVLKDPLLACQTAGWFWSKLKKLDQYGNDMRAITKKVTGASDTAIKTRMAYQARVKQLMIA
jgi:Predicted chitinase